MLTGWFAAFVFTQVVEVPVYLRAQEGGAISRRAAIAFGASALTHPVVWFVFPTLFPTNYGLMFVCAETFAVAAEGLYFRGFGLQRAFTWSLFANASSAGLGALCRYTFGWP